MGICESEPPKTAQNIHMLGRENIPNEQNVPKIENRPINQNMANRQNQIDRKNNGYQMATSNKSVPVDIIIKARQSICKIIIKSNTGVIYGTGFFMMLSATEKYLITNNHVISQNNINDDIEIEIHNQETKKLNLNNREIKYFPKPKDITIIEIKPNDEIYNDILFLDYDRNYVGGYKNMYQNVPIFLIEHPNGGIAECGNGKIVNIYNGFEFDHDISTEEGASGSPIMLYTKNINSIQVIGIHKKADYDKNLNSDTFIGEIFNN